MSPIRILIGCSPNGHDAESASVLSWTLHKHTSRKLEIHWAILSKDETSFWYSHEDKGWQTARYPTPFSPFRFGCAEFFGFKGRCIYMDSDCIVFDDIGKLWDQKFDERKAVIAKSPNRLCVSVWDCAATKDFVLPVSRIREIDGHSRMRIIINQQYERVQPFSDGDWNCLDLESRSLGDPELKICHYTSMPHQMHLPRAKARLAERGATHWFDGVQTRHFRPELIDLFDRLLIEADANGYPVSKYDHGEDFGPYQKNCLKSLNGRKPSWAA